MISCLKEKFHVYSKSNIKKKSQKMANYNVKTKRQRKRFLAPLAWDFNYFYEFCDSNETELYSKNKKFSNQSELFAETAGKEYQEIRVSDTKNVIFCATYLTPEDQK